VQPEQKGFRRVHGKPVKCEEGTEVITSRVAISGDSKTMVEKCLMRIKYGGIYLLLRLYRLLFLLWFEAVFGRISTMPRVVHKIEHGERLEFELGKCRIAICTSLYMFRLI